ncbi:MAG: hypothetical protein ACK5KT_12970 [Dysgonomonas sp.]
MENKEQERQLLFRIRALTVFYIFALFFWGVTAFPLESEVRIVCQILGISLDMPSDAYNGFNGWIATVAHAIVNTNEAYPFMAYGTDWLAFSHLVIAVAFIGLYIKPVRNKWIIYFGTIACLGVLPLALICGAVRGIPFWWRMIDCSFCVFGLIPLYFLHIYVKKLEKLIGYTPSKY